MLPSGAEGSFATGKKSKGLPVRGEPGPGAVRQVGGMGCGVACVAAILRCSYAAALTLFERPGDAQCRGFLRKEIKRLRRAASGTSSAALGRSQERGVLRGLGRVEAVRWLA